MNRICVTYHVVNVRNITMTDPQYLQYAMTSQKGWREKD